MMKRAKEYPGAHPGTAGVSPAFRNAGRRPAVPGRSLAAIFLSIASLCSAASDPKKVTYEDDVLPIFRDNCLKCHNPDKLKGDLDLTSFSSAVKGGGSGATLNAGDPDGSQLFKSITHADEPSMPPNAKLSERDIATIRRWIEGGLLQGANSKALAASKPAVDLALKSTAIGRPEGPPPIPVGLALDPFVRSERASASTALASSPWAPVVALGGAKQIVLHDSKELEFLGVLPFPEGTVCDVKFSRNGRLLVASGGRGGHSGVVAVWDITTGKRVITVGDQFDSVLAADLSADQQRIALGGPDKVLKIYLTSDGSLERRMRKHTEWVTAVEFSPNGKYLASGDRNGGLVLWEAESGHEMFTLVGHKAGITAVTWRADSEMFASASEDGTIKLWKSTDGSALRSFNAHAGGVIAARFSQDGRIVSSGRDNRIQVWDTSGKNLGTPVFKGDLPTRVEFTDEGRRIVATDWMGQVAVWDAKNGKVIGELESNPSTVAERVQRAGARVSEFEKELDRAIAARWALEQELQRAEPEKRLLATALSEVRTTLAAKEAELTALATQAAADQAAASRMESARGEIKALHVRVTAEQGKIANHEKRIAELSKKAKEAQAAVDDLRQKLELAKASFAKWNEVLRSQPAAKPASRVTARAGD
jgi:mono/diheme cytochrome c family protein